MNPHRLHTFDIARVSSHPQPVEPIRSEDVALGLAAVLTIVIVVMLFVDLMAQYALHRASVVSTPVRAATIVAAPLPPLPDEHTLAEARVEGYRAGMAAGIEQGCTAPRLSMPIAAR